MDVYSEISTGSTTFYKWSNDNNVYTEIAQPPALKRTDGSLMIIFAGENPPLDNSQATSFLNAPRNIGLVVVSDDLQNILSTGQDSSGGFYNFGGGWSSQSNTGIIWLTNFTPNVSSSNYESALRIKTAQIDSNLILIFYEVWLPQSYLRTEIMAIDAAGEVIMPRTQMPYSLRLSPTDKVVVENGEAIFIGYDSSERSLARFHFELPTVPTVSPTLAPVSSTSPTPSPTQNPTQSPTPGSTPSPTENPTQNPTSAPTPSPTQNPTQSPTSAPTPSPTQNPTQNPTSAPTVLFNPNSTLTTYTDQGSCGPRGDDAVADTNQCTNGFHQKFHAPWNSWICVATINGCCYYEFIVYECNASSPTPSPTMYSTTFITPWLVGPTTYSLNVGNNYFDGSLDLINPIGSSANLNNVAVQLFDFNCQNKKDNTNSTNAVTISSIDTSQVQSFGYSVNIDQSNIGDDTGGFVVSTGPSTGDVKFCTRVSTWEGSIEVAFRETIFILSYKLTDNAFDLTNTQIQENDPDSFITDVDTDFSVLVYRCNNYVEITTPPALEQDENLVICLEPAHVGSMAHVVHISNFNLKVYAGSATTNDYVEYNPVWLSTNGWDSNSITDVKEKPDPDDVIMISTPVIAQFFIQGHTTIKLSGNCFLEFDSAKEARAPVIAAYDMELGVEMGAEGGCFVGLMRKIRSFF